MNSFSLLQAWIRTVLVGLIVLSWGPPKASAADYVVAVDVSGSMNWPLLGKGTRITPQNSVRIEVVRKYLLEYLDSLPDGAHLHLIAFDKGIVPEKEVTLKDAATREDVRKWVAGLHPLSKTSTYLWRMFRKVLQKAINCYAASPDHWVSARVLTDGEDNDPKKPTLREVLDEFPIVDGKAMKPDLVLPGLPNLELIQELKKQAGDRANITNSALGSAFPPVIKWVPDPIRVNTSVRFFDDSKSAFKSYEWQMDGKTVSDQQTFDHIFEATCTHAVRLAVTRSDGTRDLVARSIRVSAPDLVADFLAPFDAKEGDRIQFIDRSAGEIEAYAWLIDGKAQSSTRDLVLELLPGKHEVRHTVTDVTGATKEVSKMIVVSTVPPPPPAPQARFRWSPADPKAQTEIAFADESTGLLESHNWDFNREGHSSETAPKFTFATPGQKVIRLVVRGPGGESKEEKMLTMAPGFSAPMARIILSKTSGTVPLDVKFQSEIAGDYSSVNWTFGDGQTSDDPNPVHKFSVPGTWEVKLIAVARDPAQMSAVASAAIEAKDPLSEWLWLWLLLIVVLLLMLVAKEDSAKKDIPREPEVKKTYTDEEGRTFIIVPEDLRAITREPEVKKTYTDEEGRTFIIVPEDLRAIICAILSILYLLGVLVFLFRELFELQTGNYQNFLWFLRYRDSYKALLDSPSFRLLAYAMIGGAMGGVVNGIRSFLCWHCEAAGFGWRYIWKYVTYPVLGAALPFFVYALLRSGMGLFAADAKFDNSSPGRNYAALGVGVLSGFGARDVCKWLDFQVRRFFEVKPTLIGVPNVIGQVESEARAMIERAGLSIGLIITEKAGATNAGKVLLQDPLPGAQVVPKAPIILTVGKRL